MKLQFCLCLAAFVVTGGSGSAAPAAATEQVIAINTKRSALVLLAAKNGTLYQVSFGRAPATPAAPPRAPDRYDEVFPCYGSGYMLEPALQATHSDGNTSTELMYVSHESVTRNDNITETRIRLRDRHYPFFIVLCYRCYREEDVIEQWTEITHEESGPVTLGRFASAAPRLQASNYWVTQFYGDVLREGELVEEQLTPGLKILDSKLAVRAHLYRPPAFVLALDQSAQEESGEAIGGTLAWSGNFQFAFDLDWQRRLRVLAGINPLGAQYRLKREKTFTTPAMLWSWSDRGKGQVSRNFHRWARRYGIRDGAKPRPVLLNNWETTYFNFDERKLLSLFDGGKDLGVDLFLLDDGWFSDKDPNNVQRIGLGDWEVNRKILPHGLPFLVDEARKRGLGFGIWVEPESLHLGSRLYREHPDWILRQSHRDLQAPNQQLLLDLTRPEVREFVWGVVDRVLGETPGLAYLKWDANRTAPQPGSAYLPPEEQQHVPIDYQWALYDIMRRMAEKYPQVTTMLCSGGGGRVDYGSMKYFHSFWPSDGTDPLQRIYTQWGFSHLFPGWALSAHITSMGHRPTKFAVDVALNGALGIDRDVANLAAADRATLRQGIQVYRTRIRDLVQHGDLYRLESPSSGKRAALSYVSEDRMTAAVLIYQLGETAFGPIKLRGLDPAVRYKVREINLPEGRKSALAIDGKTLSGADLMSFGFPSPLRRALESAVIELVADK